MTDDDVTTGALFVGGGLAGYVLGRLVIERWLDDRATTRPPTAPTAAPMVATPQPARLPVASGATAPTPAAPAAQARSTPTPNRPPRRPPRKPRPAAQPSEADVGPVTSPSQMGQSTSPPPTDGPVTSPAQVDSTPTSTPSAWSTGAAYYDTRGARLLASIPRRVERTRELIAQWSTYLDRYRGGLPRGVFAAAMQMESDGHPSSKGDTSLGEVGLFQITESFPRRLGLDPQLRHHNEWNFYFAGTEYNQAAWRWHRRYPDLISKGGRDAWRLARLSFAIGDGGARSHVKRALDAEPQLALLNGVYAALSTFVRKGGARPAGSQSAAKVAYRIAIAVPTNFEIGERAEAGDYGKPVRLAPPTT